VLSHHPRFFARTLKWSAIQRGIAFDTISPGNADASFTEYILTRPGDQGSETGHLDKQWQALAPQSRVFKGLYAEKGRYRLPDGSESVLYQRARHPRYDVTPLTLAEIDKRIAQALGRRIRGTITVTAVAQPDQLVEGRFERIRMICSPCRVDGVRVQKLDVTLEKPRLNLYRLWDEGRLGLDCWRLNRYARR
jgi:hypothetical protein